MDRASVKVHKHGNEANVRPPIPKNLAKHLPKTVDQNICTLKISNSVSKILGRSGEGVNEKGEGVGRKGIACSQSQTFYQTPFARERGAIVQLDWLVARQYKSDIRNLTSMSNPTSGTQQNQDTYGRVLGSIQIFCSGNVESSFAKR